MRFESRRLSGEMLDMCCLVLAGHAEPLSWRLNPPSG
jgi:hypothetical protein